MSNTWPPCLFFLICTAVMTATLAQTFYPSRITLRGHSATSFLTNVANPSTISLSLTVINNTDVIPVPRCDGQNSTETWVTSLVALQSVNAYVFTLSLNQTPCTQNVTNCCTDMPCFVQTLQVSACVNSISIATLLVEAEIYSNTTFSGTVSGNATVIPVQTYQPLGPCPCNLTAGACDVQCCCDTDCNSNMTALFNGFCYTGIFGGNVTPPFDQLCSVQTINRSPDWYPFLCVQSSLNNSPFLGYFYQGSTVSSIQSASFSLGFPPVPSGTSGFYRQGDAILNPTGNNQYFTIPQSTVGGCESNAPVAYLQDFSTTCVTSLSTCSSILNPDLNQSAIGGIVFTNAQDQNISLDQYLTYTGPALPLPASCGNVILSADYTFYWQANNLREINVTVLMAQVNLTHQGAQLTQRFTATFLNGSRSSAVLSGNPGYQVGKPVIAANGSSTPVIRTGINLWKPVGNNICSSTTPVLFGQNSFSGCFLNVNEVNCTQLRNTVTTHLRALVPADFIAMRGNSNTNDLGEWVQIFYEEPNTTCVGNCGAESLVCVNVPANMNIQIMTSVIGAVEGVFQEEILAAKISFSTVTIDCISNCTLSLPVSTSVQFISVPAQPPAMVTRFQMNATDYDCEKNEVCWQQLAYPLTQYYTGEPHYLTLAKGMILVFFFIVSAVLGGPWNRIRKAWNNITF
ncbi:tectonic-2 isoform X2 [Xenopus laevis]|uniref:Tectonic-2 isoform X2 n=1 Tax=Xenopus laevis TaxID=8355 RepID=A0A8J1L1D2_XENLA|nr:tectonic-2 isoform X2 [Xenopus laevis]